MKHLHRPTRAAVAVSAVLSAAVAGVVVPSRALAGPLAFQGAMGFGAITTGGRTGTVYHVTRLDDPVDGSGNPVFTAGTFRDAVHSSNRIIVFDVGGYVHLTSAVSAQSNLTILGQTAPGDGIGIYGAETSFYGRSNEIVRYVRFLDTTLDPGYNGTSSTSSSSSNALSIGNTTNTIFDHVAAEFAPYNNIDAGGTTGADNITLQNSMIANPIASQRFNVHWEGSQGTFINNIMANSHGRNILSKGNVQYVNNSLYNYQYSLTTGNSAGVWSFDVLNNYFVAGPSTSSPSDDFYQIDTNQSTYTAGNMLDGNKDGVLNGSPDNTTGGIVLAAPWNPTSVGLAKLSAAESYAWNMAHAGVSLKHDATTFATSAGYDQVDQQIINNLASYGTSGSLWSSETATGLSNGGLGVINGGTKPTDTDNDGVPDAWESAHGMNPAVADSTALSPLGYTMIEQYANEIADSTLTTRVWNAAGGEWNTPANWGGTAPITYDVASVVGQGAGTDGLVTVTTATPVAYQLLIGGNGSAAGEKVQVSGGTLDVLDTIVVGNNNTGTLQIDSGTVQAQNVQLGSTISGVTNTGSLVLNGGTLQVQQIMLGGGTPGAWSSGGSISWNGGTIQATGALSINAPATLGAGGGGIIDTNGNNGTFSGVISGSGALTKKGAGILTLNRTNSYSGGTVLQGGELSVASDGNLGGSTTPITFSGGVLQVTGILLSNLNNHTVNWSTFNGGFDIAAANNTFTVSQSIGGSGPVSMNGLGVLALTGANSYTGATVLNGGIVTVSADNNLGAATAPITFAGGTLRITGTTMTSLGSHTPTLAAANSTIDVNTAGNVFTITQSLNGTGDGLTKAGPGVLVLSANNGYTGDTNILAGTLRIANTQAMRKSTLNLTTTNAGTLDLNGINLTLGGLSGTQGLDLKGTTLSVGTNTETYSGVISSSIGAGAIIKNGSGTWTVSGNSTYTGPTTINAGTLEIAVLANGGVASNLGASTNAAGNLVLDGGRLQIDASSSTDRGITITANGGTIYNFNSSANTFSGGIVASGTGARTLSVDQTGASNTTSTFSAGISDGGAGPLGVTLTDVGRISFTGTAKTYSGDTNINAGTLMPFATNVMPFGPGKGNVNIASGAIMDIRQSQNINGLNGAGSVQNNSGASKTLTLGNSDAAGNFSGVISAGTGATTNIVKVGLGTQIFSGANTYNGTTTINGGALQFNTAGSIGGIGASVTVNGGAAAAAGYAIDQAFLGRIAPASTGAAALAVTSANALNFNTAGLSGASLGAVGNVSFTGTLTPAGTTYRLGGGGGTLTLPNATQLAGANAVAVVGPGVVAPTGANDYTGVTTVLTGGTFAPTIANGGLSSGMGASSNAASNLVIDGGTFKGAGVTDRAFTLTNNGGTLDNSSALSFTGPGNIVVPSGVNTTLTLTGTSTAHNTMNLGVADAGGGFVTSVLKTGTGKWTFSADGVKTYSGDTHIAAGQLEALSNDAFSHNSNLVIDTGASLELHDENATIDALQGSGSIFNSFVNGARTLTIGAGDGGGTFDGVINSGPSLNLVKTGTGTQVFTGANTYSGNTTVSGGVLTLAASGSLFSTVVASNSGATLNVNGTIPATATVNANGVVNFSGNAGTGSSTRTIDTLAVGAGGQAKVLASAFPATPAVLTVTSNLTFGAGGTLDLANNELITNLSLGTARTDISTGKIFSSTSDGGTGTLGSLDLQNGTVEVRYTLKGDANIDGKVDVGDLGALATNYGISGGATWAMGDTNYDNNIDVGDLGALATNYGSSLASGPAAGAGASAALLAAPTAETSAVPEPGALGLLGLGVIGARRRRRRSRTVVKATAAAGMLGD